jgi:hypothetical protein
MRVVIEAGPQQRCPLIDLSLRGSGAALNDVLVGGPLDHSVRKVVVAI